MKLKDLKIGKCYSRGDDAEYLVLYVTNNFAVILYYSYNHHVGTLEFWNQECLDQDYNKNLKEYNDWPITEYIDYFKFIDDNTISNRD